MLTRLGLVIMIVMFGACCFVAGVLAPATWRGTIEASGDRWLGPRATAVTPSAIASKGAKAAAGKSASTADGTPASAASTPPRLDSLWVASQVTPPAPAAGQPAYALQVGQYAVDDDAESALRKAADAAPGVPIKRFDVVDDGQRSWTVVALGRYPTADAAQQVAPKLQAATGLADLPVIRLPPDPPPSTKPAP